MHHSKRSAVLQPALLRHPSNPPLFIHHYKRPSQIPLSAPVSCIRCDIVTAATPTASSTPASGPPVRRVDFATTRWSMVLAAGRADSVDARDALAGLCQTYWYPLYAFARRRGHSPQDAEDLTQGFFAQLLHLNSVSSVAPEKGRFRAFLLASMKNFLASARDHAHAQKRDVRKAVSLDADSAETRYRHEPADDTTPESIYERQWALTLLGAVADRLRAEYVRENRGELFQELSFSLVGERSAVPYAKLAPRLGVSEGALRVAVHRLRQRYRQLLEDEIAQTVTAPGEVKEELQHLMRVLAG